MSIPFQNAEEGLQSILVVADEVCPAERIGFVVANPRSADGILGMVAKRWAAEMRLCACLGIGNGRKNSVFLIEEGRTPDDDLLAMFLLAFLTESPANIVSWLCILIHTT